MTKQKSWWEDGRAYYSHAIIPVHTEEHRLSKGEIKGDNISLLYAWIRIQYFYWEASKYEIMEERVALDGANAAWRESGDLIIYPVAEKDDDVYIDIPEDNLKAESSKY